MKPRFAKQNNTGSPMNGFLNLENVKSNECLEKATEVLKI